MSNMEPYISVTINIPTEWEGWPMKSGSRFVHQVHALFQERLDQERRYGHTNDTLRDGSGPNCRWLLPYTQDSAEDIESTLRADYEDFEEQTGLPTWVHLLREEFAEAVMESDPEKQVTELMQLAALCLSWSERIQNRSAEVREMLKESHGS